MSQFAPRVERIQPSLTLQINAEAAGVTMVPGSGFGAPGHMRVSFAASMDTIDTALERLQRFLGR